MDIASSWGARMTAGELYLLIICGIGLAAMPVVMWMLRGVEQTEEQGDSEDGG